MSGATSCRLHEDRASRQARAVARATASPAGRAHARARASSRRGRDLLGRAAARSQRVVLSLVVRSVVDANLSRLGTHGNLTGGAVGATVGLPRIPPALHRAHVKPTGSRLVGFRFFRASCGRPHRLRLQLEVLLSSSCPTSGTRRAGTHLPSSGAKGLDIRAGAGKVAGRYSRRAPVERHDPRTVPPVTRVSCFRGPYSGAPYRRAR